MSSLYLEIFKLKTLLRKGWLMRGVSSQKEGGRVESDAEHSFSMALLALEIMEKHKLPLNQLKVVKMVLYHELCEIDFGDHTTFDKISKQEKYEGELKCIKRLSKECNMPDILTLWKEFEEGKTPEARFVKQMDKLDAVLQSKIYSQIKQDNDEVFDEFYSFSKTLIQDYEDYIKDYCKQIDDDKLEDEHEDY